MSRLHPRQHVLVWLLLGSLALLMLALLLLPAAPVLPAAALQDGGQEQARMAALMDELRSMQARVQARRQALGDHGYSRNALLPEARPAAPGAAAQPGAAPDDGMALINRRGDPRVGALLGEQVVHVGDVLADGTRVLGISSSGISLRLANGETTTIKAYGNFSAGGKPAKERAP